MTNTPTILAVILGLLIGKIVIDILLFIVNNQNQKRNAMTQKEALDRLTTSVKNLTTAEESQTTLLKNLAQQIRDNASDPDALSALADSLDNDTAEINATIAENTPAATV